jgi:enoyl-CoA hydratase
MCCLLGDKITAPIAEKLNLVTRVVEDDKVLDEAAFRNRSKK